MKYEEMVFYINKMSIYQKEIFSEIMRESMIDNKLLLQFTFGRMKNELANILAKSFTTDEKHKLIKILASPQSPLYDHDELFHMFLKKFYTKINENETEEMTTEEYIEK